MQEVNVYDRLTHKYVDSWRHLDEEQFVATVKLTPPVQTEEGNYYDNLGTYVQFARIPAGLGSKTERLLLQGLVDTLTSWGCSHDFDCCGCRLVRASVQKVGPRKVLVTTDIGRNF